MMYINTSTPNLFYFIGFDTLLNNKLTGENCLHVPRDSTVDKGIEEHDHNGAEHTEVIVRHWA